MNERQVAVFLATRFVFLMVESCFRIAHGRKACGAWWPRNLGRFTTLLFGAGIWFDLAYPKLNAFCFLLGLTLWNRPKDEEPPKRRRKQEKQETEKAPPNWSGLPEAT